MGALMLIVMMLLIGALAYALAEGIAAWRRSRWQKAWRNGRRVELEKVERYRAELARESLKGLARSREEIR